MDSILFAFNLYRIQIRMMFGPKHRYRKEYDDALDALNVSGHWLYLYDALEGPKADQVCEALKRWVQAYQAKRELTKDEKWAQVQANEQQLKKELDVLIYGEFTGERGFVE